ncbi:MAG: CBS domain-containing protein [Pseudomonadota bacterium]
MPSSYQAPMRKDEASERKTQSQSTSTNVSKDSATVQKLMASKDGGQIIAIRPQDTIAVAVGILRDKRIGALAVTDATGALVGILSERDIVRKLAETPGQTLPQSVGDNMTAKVESCSPSDMLVDVLRRMTEGRFRHMPVVENGAPIGMVTIGDVVHFRLRELEHEALQLKQMIVG